MGIGERGILDKVVFPKFLDFSLHFWGGIGAGDAPWWLHEELRSWEFSSWSSQGRLEFLGCNSSCPRTGSVGIFSFLCAIKWIQELFMEERKIKNGFFLFLFCTCGGMCQNSQWDGDRSNLSCHSRGVFMDPILALPFQSVFLWIQSLFWHSQSGIFMDFNSPAIPEWI